MEWRNWLAFMALFAAYQAPEAIGQRWLGSVTAQGALLFVFFGVAWAVCGPEGFQRRYALEVFGGRWKYLPVGFALALAMKGGAIGVGLLLGIYQREAGGGLEWGALAVGIPFTFLPSIAEDLVTRGFLYRLPGRRWTLWAFVLVSSGVYVLNHIFRLEEWLMLFAFGCAYGAGVMRSGTLWGAVGLHWGWNFAGVLYGHALPAVAVSTVAARTLSGCAHLVMLCVVLAAWRLGGIPSPGGFDRGKNAETNKDH